MIKNLIKLESIVNGRTAHLLVELGEQALNTKDVKDFLFDLLSQLASIEAKSVQDSQQQAISVTETPAEAPVAVADFNMDCNENCVMQDGKCVSIEQPVVEGIPA